MPDVAPSTTAAVLFRAAPPPEALARRAGVVLESSASPWPGEADLARAVAHSYAWPESRAAVEAHRGFVLVRIDGADDLGAVAALQALTAAAREVAAMDGALALFFPSGEALTAPDEIDEAIERNPLPLDLWSNVRMFRAGGGWTLMDTVGLVQLGLDDLEVGFGEGVDPNEIADFLRSLTHFLVEQGPILRPGHTVEGPGGGTWQAWSADALAEPTRRVLRLLPVDQAVPEVLVDGLDTPEAQA